VRWSIFRISLSFVVSTAALFSTTIWASGKPKRPGVELGPPIVFTHVRGGPDSCGRGCSEWISAEGRFDEGSARRFQVFLTGVSGTDVPVFFNSSGGSVQDAIQIGYILRGRGMTVGVGRSDGPSCGKVSRSGHCGSNIANVTRLATDRARCTSACTYAFLGGSVRRVASNAFFGVHSATARPSIIDRPGRTVVDIVHDQLRRYAIEMGISSELIDIAESVPAKRIRRMSNGEMRRLGVESAVPFETSWHVFKGIPERYVVWKAVVRPVSDSAEPLVATLAFYCVPYRRAIRVVYRRKLLTKEWGVPDARIAVGTDILALTHNPLQRGSVERYFNMESGQLKTLVANETFNVDETTFSGGIKKSLQVPGISVSGLRHYLPGLEAHCSSLVPD
jgi:hypothetical protein